jgi:hypothetical protein
VTEQPEQLTIDEELETFDEWVRGLPIGDDDQDDDGERGAACGTLPPALGECCQRFAPPRPLWKQRRRPPTLRGIGSRWAEGPNSFEGFLAIAGRAVP